MLLVSLRFMDMPLSRLALIPAETTTIATNGRQLGYNPLYVLKSYSSERETPARDYLHAVLHCVFQHPFVDLRIDRDCWDTACDIAVEGAISELNLNSTRNNRSGKQQDIMKKFRDKAKPLTAEKLYHHFIETGATKEYLSSIRIDFFADDHSCWYELSEGDDSQGEGEENQDKPDDKKPGRGNSGNGNDQGEHPDEDGEPDSDQKSSGNEQADHPKNDGRSDKDETDGKGNTDVESDGKQTDSKNDRGGKQGGKEPQGDKSKQSPSARLNTPSGEARQDWSEVSRRIQTDLETASKTRGTEAGQLLQNLSAVNREKYDYAAFLRKFAVLGEVMKVNDDEFDYVYYTYGMKIFGKMPLIEPLEYKEVKRIREFVIAIDTSGSVSGELVQSFAQKTYNILKSTDSFFSRINLRIIQCDTVIQECAVIHTQEDFETYFRGMKLKGFGGTDFRPVFEHVDSLIRAGEFSNLKGLIYFTDGEGTFPSHKPGYETAFVFIDEGSEPPKVPVWAIRLTLQRNELLQEVP